MRNFDMIPPSYWSTELNLLSHRLRMNFYKIISVLLFVFGGLWWSVYTYGEVANRVNRSYQFLFRLERVSELLARAESNQRGYIAAPNPVNMSNFSDSVKLFPVLIRELQKIASEKPEQLDRLVELGALLDQRAKEMKATIQQVDAGEREDAANQMKENLNRGTSREFRSVYRDIHNEEMILLRERTIYMDVLRKTAPWACLIFCGLLICLIILPWNDPRRYEEMVIDIEKRYRDEFLRLRGGLNQVYPGLGTSVTPGPISPEVVDSV